MEAFISPIILIACLAVGYIIKHIVPTDKFNKYIPVIAGILGVILNIWYIGVFTLEAAVTGLISGLASTGCYEAFTNIIKKYKIDAFDIRGEQAEDNYQDRDGEKNEN